MINNFEILRILLFKNKKIQNITGTVDDLTLMDKGSIF